MKIRTDHKIAVGGVFLLVGAYFGWQAYATMQVDRSVFSQLKPGKVNLIGIDAGKGYKIIVANEVAQLVQLSSSDSFGAGEMGDDSDADAQNKRRVPLREMLESLQGNEKSLGTLVTALSDTLRSAELPAVEVVWDAPDLQKALDGDVVLLEKLQKDLNMKLDGTPLDEIRPSALANGIVIQAYIPVDVMVDGKVQKLKGPIKMPFKPRFIEQVFKTYAEEFSPSPQMILGRYLAKRNELTAREGGKENLRQALSDRINEAELARLYAEKPARVLSNARVVATEAQFTSAVVNEVPGRDGKRVSDIRLELTDEGRRRLWQYSRRYHGQQLLFMQEGVAIAAPRIKQELADGEVTIRQVQNNTLAREAVTLINELISKKS